ncbi:PleD family two-component system response regulator [Pleurocapsa sp. PCC 7319]|uniref:response regulator n=1 Tax=Pleurocapsa sp. PCC 7319 TaxID=118161 RepID=UPI00034A56A1|nr:response regulator [Pleurocapsa sp. PCC 7319]
MKTILIVDDLKSELDLMSQYLTTSGYSIITATNGEEAIAKILENKPDAIVTDWMMPKMGGIDICRKLKKNPETAEIPIIACTAKNRDVDRMWAIKQGVKAYVTKPCTKEELVSALQGVMG